MVITEEFRAWCHFTRAHHCRQRTLPGSQPGVFDLHGLCRGVVASASQDGTVLVWSASSGHHLLTYRGQTAPLWAVAWAPSGVCIASATGNTGDEHQTETVRVWNATTGQTLRSYQVPSVPSSTAYADGRLEIGVRAVSLFP